MVGRFQHPLVIGDLLVTREAIVLGEGHDDELSLAHAFGKNMSPEVPVDEKGWVATAVAVKLR